MVEYDRNQLNHVGGFFVNSRKIVHMFFKTLFIGGIAGFITSIFVNFQQYMEFIQPFDFVELLGVVLFYLGYALVFTVVSQTGFFAYLFIHRFGEGFFKSFWPIVQLLLILLALFDMAYFSSDDISLGFKLFMIGFILVFGFITAWIKMKKTNVTALIPSMFLMVVVTALELSMVLRAGDTDFVLLMLIPVLVANAYQLLILHKVTEVDEEHQRRIAERRKARMERLKEKEAAKKK